MLSFYDWYADLPVASPQVFGDQTDVPESGDWWDAAYLIIWGSNVPITRTPDAHWMTEARYRGQKVVVVSPDYSDHTKFADDWLAAAAGHRRRAGDGDGARDPQGVLRRPAGAPLHRLRQAVHRPAVPAHPDPARRRRYVPGKFLTAADLGDDRRRTRSSRPCSRRRRPGEPRVPERLARLPLRRGRQGKWNLDLGDVDPLLTLLAATARSR